MFGNKKKNIKEEIENIESLKNEFTFSKSEWLPKAKKVIKRCFGEESEDFKFIDKLDYGNIKHQNNIDRIKHEKDIRISIHKFLEECIKTIKKDGLFKDYTKHNTMDILIKIGVVLAIIIPVSGITYYLSGLEHSHIIRGKDKEIKLLTDSITINKKSIEMKSDSLNILKEEIDSLYQILPIK
jgi:hypothetical protein